MTNEKKTTKKNGEWSELRQTEQLLRKSIEREKGKKYIKIEEFAWEDAGEAEGP